MLVVLGACGFGTISILVTLATGAGAPLLAVIFWRYALAVPVLMATAAAARALRFDATAVRAMVLAGLGQALIAVITLSALEYVSVATLAFLFYTFPAWVALIARARHSEPLTPLRLTALGVSLAGIGVMVGGPGSSLHPLGVAFALIGAVIYAAYIPMLDTLQQRGGSLATTAWMSVGAAIFLGALAMSRGELTTALEPIAWKAILVLALISTVGAFLLFMRGLRILGPVRTAIVSTVEPFFTTLLGAWVLAQPLTTTTLIGGAMIAAAVVLLQLRNGENGTRRPETIQAGAPGPDI
jgi:drug/metabolite transporter (DMT)-like permease